MAALRCSCSLAKKNRTRSSVNGLVHKSSREAKSPFFNCCICSVVPTRIISFLLPASMRTIPGAMPTLASMITTWSCRCPTPAKTGETLNLCVKRSRGAIFTIIFVIQGSSPIKLMVSSQWYILLPPLILLSGFTNLSYLDNSLAGCVA